MTTDPAAELTTLDVDPHLLTPEQAMNQVHAWARSRVVGTHATNMLEVLAALGVHVALASCPAEILVKLAWRTPTCVELTVAWTLGTFLPREPEPHIADRLGDVATAWSFHTTTTGAKLVCLVED